VRIRFASEIASSCLSTGLTVFILAVPLASQTPPAQKPSFEVASVKPDNSGSGSSRTSSNSDTGYFRASNVTLRSLIASGFRLFDFQLVGGPDWINTAKFDIEARAESGAIPPPTATPDAGNRPDVMALMIQSLLEERFQLRVHLETRDLPVFLLTVAKNGPRLQSTVEGRAGPGGLSPGSSRTNLGPAGGEIRGSGIRIAKLMEMLAGRVGRPIIDKTNLTGAYDFSLKWSSAPGPSATAGNDPANELSGPSIFTALQEQLGLRLESAKGPVEVLVIDHVERPSEN
jgi:uncharacterized protein (TIGR03435 family)